MKFILQLSALIHRSLHGMELPVLIGQLVLTGLFMQSCVREQMDDCVQYNLTVSAVDPQGVDVISSGVVTSINLYLFDENGFVRLVSEGSSTDFLFSTEKSKTLTLVAWGNLKGDSLKIPDLQVGTSLEDARIELLQTAAGDDLPVTDLFYNRLEIGNITTRGMQNDTVKLVMERLSAALSVRVSHVAEYFGDAASNLHLVVRGTGTSLNFLGEPSGDESSYAPAMQQVGGEDVWTTPLFRVFPTGESGRIYIDLYRDNTLLFTIGTDDEGNTLRALSGKETYITVDFRYARLYVSVNVKPWDSTDQNVEL